MAFGQCKPSRSHDLSFSIYVIHNDIYPRKTSCPTITRYAYPFCPCAFASSKYRDTRPELHKKDLWTIHNKGVKDALAPLVPSLPFYLAWMVQKEELMFAHFWVGTANGNPLNLARSRLYAKALLSPSTFTFEDALKFIFDANDVHVVAAAWRAADGQLSDLTYN